MVPFFSGRSPYICSYHSTYSRMTNFGTVTREGGHVFRGQPHPVLKGRAPASSKFLGPMHARGVRNSNNILHDDHVG